MTNNTNRLMYSLSDEKKLELRVLAKLSTTMQRRRKELGLSQTDLANKLGVSQGIVSRWENGEENLTIETIAKIAVALNMQIQNPLTVELRD